MPGSPRVYGELTQRQFDLIDYVLAYVVEHDRIPPMKDMALATGVTRQGVLGLMTSLHRQGVMPERPRYAIRWFDLTDEGADVYKRAKTMQQMR